MAIQAAFTGQKNAACFQAAFDNGGNRLMLNSIRPWERSRSS